MFERMTYRTMCLSSVTVTWEHFTGEIARGILFAALDQQDICRAWVCKGWLLLGLPQGACMFCVR